MLKRVEQEEKKGLISWAALKEAALVISMCFSQLTRPLKNDFILLCLVSQTIDDLL